MHLNLAIMIYGYAFSTLLIYLVDHGLQVKYQVMACIIAIIIALCYLLFSAHAPRTNINYGFLTLPVVTLLVFRLAAVISKKKNGREFRSTWRGARYYYSSSKNWLDYLLSFFIIMIEIGWPILIVVVFK